MPSFGRASQPLPYGVSHVQEASDAVENYIGLVRGIGAGIGAGLLALALTGLLGAAFLVRSFFW